LGDIIVLAMEASEIATYSGYGKRSAAWLKMKKWFFLYRVNILRNEFFIDKCIKCASNVFPHATYSDPSIFNLAKMSA
jgi:hypothetical protein